MTVLSSRAAILGIRPPLEVDPGRVHDIAAFMI
jgi:hypothetical protein